LRADRALNRFRVRIAAIRAPASGEHVSALLELGDLMPGPRLVALERSARGSKLVAALTSWLAVFVQGNSFRAG
jgi:hypothetical protein